MSRALLLQILVVTGPLEPVEVFPMESPAWSPMELLWCLEVVSTCLGTTLVTGYRNLMTQSKIAIPPMSL